MGFDVPAAAKQFDKRIHELTGFCIDELSPLNYTKDVESRRWCGSTQYHDATRGCSDDL